MATYGYLAHHGVKGMRWGVRNYQNPDGTLTAEGRRRYGTEEKFAKAQARKATFKKIAKGAAIATGVGTAIGLTAGAGIMAYQNRDKIAANRQSSLMERRNSAMASGNVRKAARLNNKISNKRIRDIWNVTNQDKVSAAGISGRTARRYMGSARRLGGKEGQAMAGSVTGWKNIGEKYGKATSRIETGLKIIGAGAAAITAVTSGVAAVKGIANTVNNLYITKDLPVVKEGARIMNEQGYLKEDHPIYKWVIGPKK